MYAIALLALMSGNRYEPLEIHVPTLVIEHIEWRGVQEPETVWATAWLGRKSVDVLDLGSWHPETQTYASPLIIRDKSGQMWKIHYTKAYEMWRYWQEESISEAKDYTPIFVKPRK